MIDIILRNAGDDSGRMLHLAGLFLAEHKREPRRIGFGGSIAYTFNDGSAYLAYVTPTAVVVRRER